MGTVGYMAPEQVRGQAVDHRTDIFAFGAILYEALSGRRAFRKPTSVETMNAILNEEPASVSQLVPTITLPLQRIVQRCLEKKPEQRFQSAPDLAFALEALSESGSSSAMAQFRAIGLSRVWMYIANIRDLVVDLRGGWRHLEPTTLGDAASVAASRARSRNRSLKMTAAGVGVVAVLAASVATWTVIHRSRELAERGRPDFDALPIRLRPVGSEFARMVFVPGGAEGDVQLTDYWLDRTEVTNRDFKTFVDRGGYEDARYWTELAATRQSGGIFRDRTGRPDPSTWELGTFPDGQDDYPVNGVSWFEALAHCRSVGKTLPTVSHWRKAFGATFFMEAVTVGNFNGRGPESTTRLKDVGPWGTFGMAGNVKVWVWNEINGQRYILGGAWNEPVYMAIDDDSRPPMDRAAVNGFRCVKETAPSVLEHLAQPKRVSKL